MAGNATSHTPAAQALPRHILFVAQTPCMLTLAQETIDAYRAYSELSGSSVGAGCVGSPTLELVSIESCTTDAFPRSAKHADSVCIMAVSPGELKQLSDVVLPHLESSTRIVALCASDDLSAKPAHTALEELAATTLAAQLIWHGGIAFGGAQTLPRLVLSPRLGTYRRPLSQALDTLIATLRSGQILNLMYITSDEPLVCSIVNLPWTNHGLAYRFFARSH